MILAEAVEEVRRLSRQLDAGLDVLRGSAEDVAQAEQTYRKAKSLKWVQASEGTAAQRAAWVDGETADLRYARDLAEGMRRAALESVRARATQISAVQSILNAYREEAAFARTAPQEGP